MAIGFILGVILFCVLTGVLLVQVRLRLEEVGELWYGLVPVGAAGALVALLAQMGLLMLYAMVTGMPAEMTRQELSQRMDILLFNTAVIAVFLEVAKVYAVHLFHTRMERGNWPLYGMATGAGAGLLQSLLVLGPTAWVAATDPGVIEVHQLWLLPQYLALVAMEVALGGLVLYQSARGRMAYGLILGGALHVAALVLPALAERWDIVGAWLPMVRTLVFAVAAGIAGATLAYWIKHKGWPF